MVRRFDTIYIICKILKFAKNAFLKEQNFVREIFLNDLIAKLSFDKEQTPFN
jgi:hypothetical protein